MRAICPCSHYFRFGGNQAERDAKAAGPPAGTSGSKGAPVGAAAAAAAAAGSKKEAGNGVAAAAAGGKKAPATAAAGAKGPAAKKEPEGPPDVSRLDIRVRLF
jgi:hypothetical protein